MRSILAFMIVGLSFGFLFALLFVKLPTENKDILQIATGLVLAALGFVTGYYFGSSKNESDKAKSEASKSAA
jgi:uncharacterized BrkB/YihY/UPF0761 family membrane protein